MELFLLRNLPEQVKEEDLENAFAEFGSIEYVKIKPPTPAGRLAIIKMAKVGGKTYETRERQDHEFKGRTLRLVKPKSEEKGRGEVEQPLSKKKGMNPLAKAIEYFLRSLKILKPLPEKVKVKS